MNELRNDVVINRALLTNPALDSGAVAVRGTLFHVFREAGDHDVTILRGDRVTARLTVVVQPEGATPQVNLDLARLEADSDSSGNATGHYAVREGGVMGFPSAWASDATPSSLGTRPAADRGWCSTAAARSRSATCSR